MPRGEPANGITSSIKSFEEVKEPGKTERKSAKSVKAIRGRGGNLFFRWMNVWTGTSSPGKSVHFSDGILVRIIGQACYCCQDLVSNNNKMLQFAMNRGTMVDECHFLVTIHLS